jgi:hypothetical protein
MCLIVDTNLAAVIFSVPPDKDFLPIIDWLMSSKKDGKLVVGGKLAHELSRVNAVRRFVKALQQAGRVRIIPSGSTEVEAEQINDLCESNDAHIIALARVSGARILCSHDEDLHKDFTNPSLIANPRGHIYQNSKHSHLLQLYGHTEACRRSVN